MSTFKTEPLEKLLTEKNYIAKSKNFIAKDFKRSKGRKTISDILHTTLKLIAKQGYSSVSLADVAREIGIAKGNLQYYFPTRDSLLRSAMFLQMEEVKKGWLNASKIPADNAWEKLENLVNWDLKYSRSEERKAIALEKRAYASRDTEARKILIDWYEWVIDGYADLLAEIRPDLDRNELCQLSALVNGMLEGLAPYFGRHRVRKINLKSLDKKTLQAIYTLVKFYPHN